MAAKHSLAYRSLRVYDTCDETDETDEVVKSAAAKRARRQNVEGGGR